MRNEQPLLAVEELQVTYGGVPALQGVSLAVAPGEILGVVGESGCGKSTLLDAVLRLPRRDGRIAGGRIVFAGRDLAALGGRELRRLRGEQLGVVYQNPGETLNPSRRIRTQFYEALRAHRSVTRAEANTIAAAQMARLHLEEPEALLDSYPFQLSGGMAQRVALALAMVLEPQLLLADEPTSALDVTVQARVVEELLELRAARGTAILLVTHNLGVVARMADRVAVMYAGRLVESGTREQVLTRPAHPYTRALLAAVPDFSGRLPRGLPGKPPLPGTVRTGCEFAARCPRAEATCRERPPVLRPAAGGQQTACWKEATDRG